MTLPTKRQSKQFVGRTIALCEFRWEETARLGFGQRADLADIRRIGIPRALLYYRYGIAWRTFFTELGLEVVLDAPSDRGTFEVGDRLSVDECCLASKLFLGHVAALVDQGVDAVFVPSLMGYGRFDTFCTKFQALPDLAENAFIVAGRRVRVVSFRTMSSLARRRRRRISVSPRALARLARRLAEPNSDKGTFSGDF